MTVEIPLPSGHVALVDDDDLLLVAGSPWHVHRGSSGILYAVWQPYLGGGRKGARKGRVFMHHRIAPPLGGMVTDHRNGDGLDNRRQNLRTCTQTQNVRNQRPRAGRLKGVSAARNGFQVRVAGRYLGYYQTDIEAALAYDHAAKQMFGEFARLNFPGDLPAGFHALPDSKEIGQWRHKRIASARK